MPYKDREKRLAHSKEYGASYYQRNKEKVKARTAKRKKERRKEWQEYKATLCCANCGFGHPAVIDFHHPHGSESKDHRVSALVQAGRFKAAYEEASNCVPLCCNCHRILHYEEREKDANKRTD
jgi:hypothetical protein